MDINMIMYFFYNEVVAPIWCFLDDVICFSIKISD